MGMDIDSLECAACRRRPTLGAYLVEFTTLPPDLVGEAAIDEADRAANDLSAEEAAGSATLVLCKGCTIEFNRWLIGRLWGQDPGPDHTTWPKMEEVIHLRRLANQIADKAADGTLNL